jgi:leader peptidase (prepilin peptidase)/N-methyltransferase
MQYIVIFILCLFLGNLMTSFYFRLPRKISLAGYRSKAAKPMCSNCKRPLQWYEYLPVLNWLTSRGKCKKCGWRVDRSYLVMELGAACLGLVCFWRYGSGESFFVALALSLSGLLALMLFLQQGYRNAILSQVVLALALVHAVISGTGVFGLLISAVIVLLIYMAWTHFQPGIVFMLRNPVYNFLLLLSFFVGGFALLLVSITIAVLGHEQQNKIVAIAAAIIYAKLLLA